MSIHVQLERFEGPLGLLLHLIREQEMDIFNINIHQITRQYLEYIKTMRRLDLEVAGEFVAMASTLLHIKSRMLLPQYNEEGEEIVEDPRKELVQKLVEYKRIRELSGELYKRPLLGRDVFTRGERETFTPEADGELVLEENPLFSLIAAYRTSVRNMKKTVHKVVSALQSIAQRIMEMKTHLVVGRKVVFRDLITTPENVGSQVLVTFLALLELAKMGFVSVFQSEPFADIHIEAKRDIDGAAVSRAENYDSVNAGAKADEILMEAQLTLDEPKAELEGEGETVVQEGFADAASDDDIEAEERRLFEEAGTSASAATELGSALADTAPLEATELDVDAALAEEAALEAEVAVEALTVTEAPIAEPAAFDPAMDVVDVPVADVAVSVVAAASAVVAEDVGLTAEPSGAPTNERDATLEAAPAGEPAPTLEAAPRLEAATAIEPDAAIEPNASGASEASPAEAAFDAATDVVTESVEALATLDLGGDRDDVAVPADAPVTVEPATNAPADPPSLIAARAAADFVFLTTPEPAVPQASDATSTPESARADSNPEANSASAANKVKEKLDDALSAALSAFNAFNDEPEVKS